MYNSFLIMIFFFLILNPIQADIIHMKNGRELFGAIEGQGETLKIHTIKGAIIHISQSEIDRVEKQSTSVTIEKSTRAIPISSIDSTKIQNNKTPHSRHKSAVTEQEIKLGRYSTTFTERSPHSNIEHVLSRTVSENSARKLRRKLQKMYPGKDTVAHSYQMEEQWWEVYVPQDYQDNATFGLLVLVSPTDMNLIYTSWLEVFDKYHLIVVSAYASGNKHNTVTRRIPLALDGAYNIQQRYSIDQSRVYVGGVSGGGRVSSMMAVAFPELFDGGYFLIGCNFYKTFRMANGRIRNARFMIQQGPSLEKAKKSGHYVFLTGDNDGNLLDTQGVIAGFQKEGFLNTTYIQVPEMGHIIPDANWFEKGIAALESR